MKRVPLKPIDEKQDKEMKRILKIAHNSPLGTPPQTLYANHAFNTSMVNYAPYPSPANISSSSTSTSPQSDFSTPDSPLTSNHKKKQAGSQRKGTTSEAKPRGRGRPANQPPPPPLPLPALPPPLPGTITTYMRSSRPLSYRMNELNTIDDVFHELGILNQPRTAPGMNKLYEDLYIDVVKLLEVKHTVQQLEEDANKIKTKITPKQPPTPTTIVIPSSKKKEKKQQTILQYTQSLDMPPPDNSLTFESPSPGSSNSPRNQKPNKRSVSPALDLIDQPMPKRQRRDIDWKVFDKKGIK